MAVSFHLCRFPSRTDLSAPPDSISGGPVGPLRCWKQPLSVRCSAEASPSPGGSAVEADFDPKVFWHNLMRSKNYNRKGFGHKEETMQLMDREYTSEPTLANFLLTELSCVTD